MVITPYSWILGKKATIELEDFPKEIQKRIIEKLDKSRINPFKYFIRLKGRTDYKLRVGDYRIIADINTKELRLEVTKVGHRKDVYK
jgi:mRNA interferase RelE/StbE